MNQQDMYEWMNYNKNENYLNLLGINDYTY